MELIRIVDINGDFTGEMMDRKIVHDKNLLHNEISVLIINEKKQVLLQKRSATKRFNPNKWGLISGHVDGDETLIEAAIRETHEEIGLLLNESDLHSFCERELKQEDVNSHFRYFFYVNSSKDLKGFIIQKEEVSEIRWFDIDNVIDMINSGDTTITFDKRRLYVFEKLKKVVYNS